MVRSCGRILPVVVEAESVRASEHGGLLQRVSGCGGRRRSEPNTEGKREDGVDVLPIVLLELRALVYRPLVLLSSPETRLISQQPSHPFPVSLEISHHFSGLFVISASRDYKCSRRRVTWLCVRVEWVNTVIRKPMRAVLTFLASSSSLSAVRPPRTRIATLGTSRQLFSSPRSKRTARKQ